LKPKGKNLQERTTKNEKRVKSFHIKKKKRENLQGKGGGSSAKQKSGKRERKKKKKLWGKIPFSTQPKDSTTKKGFRDSEIALWGGGGGGGGVVRETSVVGGGLERFGGGGGGKKKGTASSKQREKEKSWEKKGEVTATPESTWETPFARKEVSGSKKGKPRRPPQKGGMYTKEGEEISRIMMAA